MSEDLGTWLVAFVSFRLPQGRLALLLPWFDTAPNTPSATFIKSGQKLLTNSKWNVFETFINPPPPPPSISVALDWRGQKRINLETHKNVSSLYHVSVWPAEFPSSVVPMPHVSSVRLPALGSAVCAVSASPGGKGTAVHLALLTARCCCFEQLQKLVHIWHRRMAFGQQS